MSHTNLSCLGQYGAANLPASLTLVLALKALHSGNSLVLSKLGQLVLLAVVTQQCAFALLFSGFPKALPCFPHPSPHILSPLLSLPLRGQML